MSRTVCRLFPLLALGLLISHRSYACDTVTTDGKQPIHITDESALIVWDEKAHTEQFIRRASFETEAKNFGFLVPTPSRPSLAEADDALFDRLEAELRPKVMYKVHVWQDWTLFSAIKHSFSYRSRKTFSKDAETEGPASEGSIVKVVEQAKVGGYDATVLEASDASALKTWLIDHHYAITADFEDWATSYIQRRWYLTAFQVASTPSSGEARLKSVNLTFRTNAPFYPYRESKRAQQLGGGRTLRVFFIGASRTSATIENGSRKQMWPAETQYSAKLGERTLNDEHVQLPPGPLRLTAFTDLSSPRPGWGDLKFSSSADQSNIEEPHILMGEDNHSIYYPVDLALIAIMGGALCWGWKALLKRSDRSRVQKQST